MYNLYEVEITFPDNILIHPIPTRLKDGGLIYLK